MQWLDYVVLALYAVGMVFIALYTKKRSQNNVKDFLLAGNKGLNGWMSAFSYGTTYFSAVIFIGYAGKFGWSFGLSSVWIGIGNALLGGLLAWIIMAKRTKNMTVRLQAKTMPEFFEKRYESKGLRTLSAIIIFIFLIPYAASVYNGLGNLFEVLFGIDGTLVVIILAVLTALYLVFGGYFATALSDFVQGLLMIAGVIVMFAFFMANDNVNGIEGIKKLTESGFGFFTEDNGSGFLNSPVTMLVSLILLTSMGVYGLPQTVHKYYSVRDKKAVKQGMIISTLFAFLIGFVAYFIGGLGRLFFADPSDFGGNTDNIIPLMLDKVIPIGFLGLIGVLVLSASMSTLASVSLASASVLSVDLYKERIKTNASEKRVTVFMRIACFLFIALSVVIALLNKRFNVTAIAYLMSISWGTLSGCFFGPFVLGLYSRKLTKTAGYASVVGGLIFTAVFTVLFGAIKAGGFGSGFGAVLKEGVGMSPLTGVLCMIFSVIITLVVSSFTKKPSDETVAEAFDKVIENEIK